MMLKIFNMMKNEIEVLFTLFWFGLNIQLINLQIQDGFFILNPTISLIIRKSEVIFQIHYYKKMIINFNA